jgi:SAM-dependent methyltransferase
MNRAASKKCPNCLGIACEGMATWHFLCESCGLEMSTLKSVVDITPQTDRVDESARERSLKDIREKNFREVAFLIKSMVQGQGLRLLDVGSAHGWFLDAAKEKGFYVTGMEPSAEVARGAIDRGHEVLIGLFPDDLPNQRKFDVIAFNDVFEHIPAADETLKSIAAFMENAGLLVLSIPSNKGFFYRLSKRLYSIGIKKPFERMWQMDFPSPHLYYFNSKVLQSMAANAGFALVYQGSLPSVRVKGLWSRLRYDQKSNPLFNAFVYGVILLGAPVLHLVRPDIDLLIFRKETA